MLTIDKSNNKHRILAIDDQSEEEFSALTEYQQDYILTVSQNYLDYQIERQN